jgi:hypothetical protein
MTSLQQTAMLGGAASAKTASYTLVAADAGTAISMSNAGATTITVNTGLFAAGDTVHITNLGAGVCTITAGTATVNSSASLALAQYESGFLDFTSTSASIFVKGAGAAATSGGMTLISTTTLSGGSTTLSSIPSTYIDLYVVITAFKPSSDGAEMRVEINGDNTANRSLQLGSFAQDSVAYGQNYWKVASPQDDTTATGIIEVMLPNYKNTTTVKMAKILSVTNNQGSPSSQINYFNNTAVYNQTTAISSLTFFPTGGSFTSGTIQLYGVQ